MKVLMVGATGKYASLVVPELKQRDVTIRALVRDKDKAAAARRQGVDEAAIADLRDSKSLRTAASGVDGVFHINPALAPDEAALGVAMVEAAKAAGVRKFVFSGVIHPSLSNSVTMQPSVRSRRRCMSRAWNLLCYSPPGLCNKTLSGSGMLYWSRVTSPNPTPSI